MTETGKLAWRLLGKDEWDKLEAFFASEIGPVADMPNPAATEVIVLEMDGQILAAQACIVQLVFSPLIASDAVPDQAINAVYTSGVEQLRALCESNGLAGSSLLAIQEPDSDEVMGLVGLSPTGATVYTGTV